MFIWWSHQKPGVRTLRENTRHYTMLAFATVRAKVLALEQHLLEHGSLKFTVDPAPPPWREEGYTHLAHFSVPLGFDDLILLHL